MAAKISTLILTVDLECHLCSKKIRKTLSKLQDREGIETITYDEKKNTVTISGPFDPHKLRKKLCCKAGKVIKDIKIKEEEKKPPPKPAESEKPKPPPSEEKPKPPEPQKEKPKPPEPQKEKPKPPEPEKEKPKPPEPEKEKPKPPPKEPEPEPKKTEPVPAYLPMWPVLPVGPAVPICCWQPCYEGYYGGCRCCSCGMISGYPAPAPAPPVGPSTSICHFFSEEEPSLCSIV